MTERQELIQRLHQLADGDLSGPEATEIKALLITDTSLSVYYASIIDVKAALSQLPRETHVETFVAIKGRLIELDRAKHADQFVGKYAWGICGIVFVFIVGAGIFSRTNRSPVGLSDVPVYSAGLVSSGIGDTSRSVAGWLKRLFVGSKTPQAQPLPILKEDMGMLGNTPAARIILGNPTSPYTLFILRSQVPISGLKPVAPSSPYSSGHLGPWNCVNWSQGSFQLLLVGNHDEQDLEQVAGSVHVR